jgi:hypothetical protein
MGAADAKSSEIDAITATDLTKWFDIAVELWIAPSPGAVINPNRGHSIPINLWRAWSASK